MGGGTFPKKEMRALLINSAGTSGFFMHIYSNDEGTRLFRFNPMSNT
jgi:hypothetical protein